MIAFMKKELMEHIKTYKVLILLSLSFIFGMLSPLLAKLMPDIMKEMAIEGITITVLEPTAIDAYSQFFKNMTQMGLLVLVLVFSGLLTTELTKGTLINLLTKGLSRTNVILSKYIVAIFIWSGSVGIAALTTYGYTLYLFSTDDITHLGYSVGCLWLFGSFLLALIIFWQTLIQSQYGNLLMVALSVAVLFFINIIPALQHYNPITLISNNVAMLSSQYDLFELLPSVGVTAISTISLLVAAIVNFKHKQLKKKLKTSESYCFEFFLSVSTI